jgi:hypothetical protein
VQEASSASHEEAQQNVYDPEKLSSLMQRTKVSEASQASEGWQQTLHQPKSACSFDIKMLRDVTGCTHASDEFLEHVAQENHGNLEVRASQ